MNKLIKNFFSTSVANIIGQLVCFISITYYSGILGTHNYGLVTYAQMYVLFFTTVVLFGVQTFGTKLVVKKEKENNLLVNELFSFRLIIAIVGCLICFLISFFISKDSKFPLVLIIWSLILIPTALNFDWFFSGIQDMKHNAVYNLFKTVLPAIVICLLMKEKTDIYIVPIAMVLGVLFGAIYYLFILKRYNIKLRFTYNKETFKKYFIVGLPFLLSALLSMVNGNIDKLIFGLFDKYSLLGVYQAAYNFINFIVTFIGIIFLPLFPYIIKVHMSDKIGNTLKVITKVVLSIVIPLSVGVFILADNIISLFYKVQFAEAVIPLRILMVYIFIFAIREVYAYSLNAFGLEKKYLKIVGVSALLNCIFNLIFIPFYGYYAAAIVTTLTEIINLVFMRKSIRKIAKFNDIKEILLLLIPSIIMGLFIVFIKMYTNSIFIIIPLAIILYGVVLFGFKIFKINELKEAFED